MKQVTFIEFFTTIGCGFWQLVRWVASLFGYKDESKYGIFVRRFFAGTLSVIVFSIAFMIIIYSYEYCKSRAGIAAANNAIEEADYQRYISRKIYMYDKGDGNGYIYNMYTGEKLIEHIAWIGKPHDGDSLVCYSDGDKRGYFNAFTGKVVIPPTYKKAWIFSDGLAAVQKDNDIFFIDHQGKLAFKKSFESSDNSDGYCFHNGYSIIAVGDCHFGVINKKGEWAIPPKYIDLHRARNGYWVVKDKNGFGLMNDSMKMVLPCTFNYLTVDENGILVQYQDNSMQRLNFDMTVKDKFVYEDIEQLVYETTNLDKKGNPISAVAPCRPYKVSGFCVDHYGLMEVKGRPLTKPAYDEIVAINRNLYLCKAKKYGILINSHGEKVN